LRGDRNFRRWSTAGGSGALRGVFKDYTWSPVLPLSLLPINHEEKKPPLPHGHTTIMFFPSTWS
jgi:hypothetical protein